MKFSKLSQLFLVSIIGLVVATLLTSCEITTIDYVFVADSVGSGAGAAGQIETFDADSQTGALRAGQPAVPSGGTNPVSLAVSTDYQNLYVANQGSNTVVHFAIDGSGVLTKKDSVTLAAPPVSIAVETSGKYLFVASGTTSATLTAYTLSSGAIGSVASQQAFTVPGNSSDALVPTGVNVLANGGAVYVSAYDQSAYNPGGTTTSDANPGWVFGCGVGTSGVLSTPVGYKAGIKPTAVTSDPTSRFVYVTDFASNQLVGYTILEGGALNFMVNGPFRTGSEPQAVAIDPRGLYLYVANALDSSVSAYDITLATGAPASAVNPTGSAVNSTDTTPVAIVVDAALGRFLYTANNQGNSISGFRLDVDTGTLSITQATPYPSGFKPAAVATIPHGSHAVQTVSP